MMKKTLSVLTSLIASAGVLAADFCMPVPVEGEVTVAFDMFRGTPDFSFQENTGAYISANFGMPVPLCEDWGLGFQLGGSYGVYDWYGRTEADVNHAQQQGFLTTGLFRRSACECGINLGLVYDVMFNDNLGHRAHSPTLQQLRFKGGYNLDACNEVGVWGTANLGSVSERVDANHFKYRAIGQINLFWQHNFDNCAYVMAWAGLPYTSSLAYTSGRSGSYLFGSRFSVPLDCRWKVSGHFSYMGSRHGAGQEGARGYGANAAIGLTYAFGIPSSSCTCTDIRPYLPVADNTDFLVDAGRFIQ